MKTISGKILTILIVFACVLSISCVLISDDNYAYADAPCNHYYDSGRCIRKATLESYGIMRHECYYCSAYYDRTFSWALSDPDSELYTSYNIINYSDLFPKSKSITVWLDNIKSGSIVKVKVGKKTYKKTVTDSKKLKIKVKKPKYGQRVSLNVYYQGNLIGRGYFDDDGEYCLGDEEIVYYARKIKKGMTKKQVRCLFDWGDPSRTASGSGGRAYFYYDDGSVVFFKKGRVKSWYNAAY